ncbi:MAG: isoprenylcysteine carboxylmethyltransferase family protein [Azospirillaceae bacterium]
MSQLAGPVDIARVQRIRKTVLRLAALMLGAFVMISSSRWASHSPAHEVIEQIGIGLIVVAILGRCWSILYMGDGKSRRVVCRGPYSVTRNPLYFFAFIGAVGIGFQLGGVSYGAIVAGVFVLVFLPVTLREERHLENLFGEEFRRYKARVPRFIPKPGLWQDAEQVTLSPRALVSTFLDACLFLFAVPAMEFIEYLHDDVGLPSLMLLP